MTSQSSYSHGKMKQMLNGKDSSHEQREDAGSFATDETIIC